MGQIGKVLIAQPRAHSHQRCASSKCGRQIEKGRSTDRSTPICKVKLGHLTTYSRETALSLVAFALARFRQSGCEKVVSVTVKLPPSQSTPKPGFSI